MVYPNDKVQPAQVKPELPPPMRKALPGKSKDAAVREQPGGSSMTRSALPSGDDAKRSHKAEIPARPNQNAVADLRRMDDRFSYQSIEGGALFTMSYYGAEKVIEHYNVMGPVKAALESAVRYLAYELGPRGIRVHAISPGPVKTRAASGIDHFDELMERAAARAPARRLVSIEDVGVATAVLATDYAKLITGETVYVDGGYHILG